MPRTEEKQEQPLPASPAQLFALLDRLEIVYKTYHHDPIFTVEEGEHLKAGIPGEHCRNLFLRDKKKAMFLVVAANDTKVDLKALPGALDCGRLSFGSAERLWDTLGIRPGSVCPFCVMNDTERSVTVILDRCMMDRDLVNYHPLDNAMTIGLSPAGLLKFLGHTGHAYQIIDLSSLAA